MLLVFWWVRIVSVAVGVANLAVGAVNYEFRFVRLGEFFASVNRLLLGGVNGPRPLGSLSLDCPAFLFRDNVVIPFVYGFMREEWVIAG